MARVLSALGLVNSVVADVPKAGSYSVTSATVTDAGLEEKTGIDTRDYVITYPKQSTDEKFPLIVFAHGAAGGRIDMLAYQKHFNDLAAYGYVVIAPKSCFMGCSPPGSNASNLGVAGSCLPWTDGPQWTSFVHENTRAIKYAKASSEDWSTIIDWDAGLGVAGHSMGGEVVSQMGSAEFKDEYNVKAVVCEHCQMCEVDGTVIETPAMFMTGTGDYEVQPRQVKGAYNEDPTAPKVFRNDKGRGHTEMLNLLVQYNSAVASHAAAFFKTHINGDQGDFYAQIYANGTDSFCGYEEMYECFVTPPNVVV
jgi:dienelactone hydrolase